MRGYRKLNTHYLGGIYSSYNKVKVWLTNSSKSHIFNFKKKNLWFFLNLAFVGYFDNVFALNSLLFDLI